LSPATSKEADTEADPTDEEDEIRDKTRGEIEVLILVSGLILTPLFYFWQTGVTTIQSIAVTMWQNYLQSQTGHPPPFSFNEMVTQYFSSFGLVTFLPADMFLWLCDITVLLSIVALLIFGYALMTVESGDVKQIRALAQKGRTCLDTVLLVLITGAVFHMLNNSMLPIKALFQPFQIWIIFGIALLTGITVNRFLNSYMKRAALPLHQKRHVKKSETPQLDSISTEP
jgi:hypothetical protein